MFKLTAQTTYVSMRGADALLRTTMYIVLSVYYVLVVHMNALELVLAGTMLELTYFLFQIPTGIFADVYSRRLSVILGWVIAGSTFVAEGLFARVVVILVAQAVMGMGEALIAGAESAWLADEVGEELYGPVMLRASQVGQVAAVAGILASVALGGISLNLPVVVGGALLMVFGGFLAVVMPETAFRPAKRDRLLPWESIRHTLSGSIRLIRGNTVLLAILGVELLVGAGSEGFDRLWEAHIIRDIHLPSLAHTNVVMWFALTAILESVAAFAAGRLLRPRLERLTNRPGTMARLLSILNMVNVAAFVGFAFAGNLALAFLALIVLAVVRVPNDLVTSVWFNQNIPDPSVRATVMSMLGQTNALGQWTGGPLVGVLGAASGLTAALAVTGLIRVPISAVYSWTSRRHRLEALVDEEALSATS